MDIIVYRLLEVIGTDPTYIHIHHGFAAHLDSTFITQLPCQHRYTPENEHRPGMTRVRPGPLEDGFPLPTSGIQGPWDRLRGFT